jgi:hypothetical protein
MTICSPSRSESHCAITRVVISVGPPAGKPTIKRIGRDGPAQSAERHGACAEMQ